MMNYFKELPDAPKCGCLKPCKCITPFLAPHPDTVLADELAEALRKILKGVGYTIGWEDGNTYKVAAEALEKHKKARS